MKQILLLLTIIILTTAIADAATLTCTQVSEASLSIPQSSSKTIELRCTASGGTVNNIQITPNPSPGSGLTITSTQTMSTSIADSASSTAKWSATGDTPNTYTISYTITSDGTKAWSGAETTSATVTSPASLTVVYVDAPATYVSGDTLDISISNIGGTSASSVKLQLNSHDKVTYPSSIEAGASASYSWTGAAGYNAGSTYITKVYIGDVLQDTESVTVAAGASTTTSRATTTSSATTAETTTTASAGGGNSGGGSSGGGGLMPPITTTPTTIAVQTTNTLTLIEGTFTLKSKETVGFTIGGSQHVAKLVTITSASVTLQISSAPFNVTIAKGESKAVDTNGNGINDLEIKVNSIKGVIGSYSADISFKVLPEPVTTTATTILQAGAGDQVAAASDENKADDIIKKPLSFSSYSLYILVGLAVLAVIIVFVALIVKRKH